MMTSTGLVSIVAFLAGIIVRRGVGALFGYPADSLWHEALWGFALAAIPFLAFAWMVALQTKNLFRKDKSSGGVLVYTLLLMSILSYFAWYEVSTSTVGNFWHSLEWLWHMFLLLLVLAFVMVTLANFLESFREKKTEKTLLKVDLAAVSS